MRYTIEYIRKPLWGKDLGRSAGGKKRKPLPCNDLQLYLAKTLLTRARGSTRVNEGVPPHLAGFGCHGDSQLLQIIMEKGWRIDLDDADNSSIMVADS
jgi:hypothetical protein